MKIYFDTSFVVSVYSSDANSEAALASLEAAGGIRLITAFGKVEVVNALMLRVFRKELSASQVQSSLANFEKDLDAHVFQLRPFPEQIFDRARSLAQQLTPKLGIRTADLLHVAAAVELGANCFYSFDKQQRKLASAMRLERN